MNQCFLNKEKVKEGITSAILERVKGNSLFTVEGNIINLLNTKDRTKITPEQQEKIDSSVQFADELQGVYKYSFLQNPELFLREIAEQANSSVSESGTALSVAGPNLFDIAVTVFPNEGIPTKALQEIENINKEFKSEVFEKIGPNKFIINPSNTLIMNYIMHQPGSKDVILQELRDHYVSMFNKDTLNLMSPETWINHPILEDPTIQKILDFAKKINPNFKIGVIKDLDQKAVSLIRDNIILIRNGHIIDELPEEISHFFIELLPDDNPLKIRMLKEVVNHKIYGETYENYKSNPLYQKNGKPDTDKIKREATAKLVGEYIKAAWTNTADTKYGNKRNTLRELVKQFMKALRKLLMNATGYMYTEPLMGTNSPFADAANDILSQNISDLNLKKIPNIYDSIFFSKVEDAIDEGYEAPDIVKAMYELSRSLGKKVHRTFYTKIQHMSGLREVLDDPIHKEFNRVFNITEIINDANLLLKDVLEHSGEGTEESRKNREEAAIVQASARLAEAYREMEIIPQSIRAVIRDMKESKTENELIDNITELQTYFKFSDTFRSISSSFIELLDRINKDYKSTTYDANDIYNRMIDKMGATSLEFSTVDKEIMRMLQTHVIGLMDNWTEKAFEKYKTEIDELYGKANHTEVKNKIKKLLQEKITNVEQIRQVVTGNFPLESQLKLNDGTKIDISKLKDITQIDYLIFMFASPSLAGDPFISNLMAFYTDHFISGVVKGKREAKEFADRMLPIKEALNMDYYEAERIIQFEEEFHDMALPEKKTKKRVFLSETNRAKFNFDLQEKNQKIGEITKLISDLQKDSLLSGTLEEKKDAIKAKQEELRLARLDFEDFLDKFSYRQYIDEYYDKIKTLRASRSDSPVLARIKEINAEILLEEQRQYVIIALDSSLQEPLYERITERLANLQNQKMELSIQLPETEKSVFEIMEDLYEEDKIRTERLRTRHRLRWVDTVVKTKLNDINNRLSEDQLREDATNIYDNVFISNVPKQEFYDKRDLIFKEISKVAGTNIELETIAKTIDDLRKKEKEILKNFRNVRYDVSVSSFKYSQYSPDLMTSEILKEIETEIDTLSQKMKIYSRILNNSLIGDNEKRNLKNFVELLFSFNNVINYPFTRADKIVENFKPLINLTISQAEQIKTAINKALQGDNSDLQNIPNMNFDFVSPDIKQAFGVLRFDEIESMIMREETAVSAFKQIAKGGVDSETLTSLFSDLNNMYVKYMSFDYLIVMSEFFSYFRDYILDDSFENPNKELHRKKLDDFNPEEFWTADVIEQFLADGTLEATLDYIEVIDRKGQITTTKSGVYALSDYVRFIRSLHKTKTIYINNELTTTSTPVSYVRKILADPSLSEKRFPRFLTKSKVKDSYRTEKINELDPRVRSGAMKPNVDINGEWLPREDRLDSPYLDKRYSDLQKNNPAAFKFLEAIKEGYLKKQTEFLEEGERLDLVIPARYLDQWEQHKQNFTNVREGINKIRNSLPFSAANKGLEAEETELLEDIGAITAQNRDIYTGAIIAERAVKLRSRRRLPIQRTSVDATASVAGFIEEVNEYEAKNLVSPIFKTFADVLTNAHETNSSSNKLRSEVLRDIYSVKILDEAPKNFANNPQLAKVLNFMSKFAVMRLMGDPLGAFINFSSGTIQSLIEAAWDKNEYKSYMQSGWKAKDWLFYYDRDFYRQSSWSRETQLITIFNMIPDTMDISKQLSTKALVSNWQAKLMSPRSESEKYLAIHLGLGILNSRPVTFNGIKYHIDDLYDTDEVTNLVKLKDEFKSLEKEWNPENGTEVMKMRRLIMQKYTLLQGNFFDINQSYASETALGRAGELMKRWFVSGVIRRFQGEVLDPFTGDSRKGYHLAMMHLFKEIFHAIKKGDINYIKDHWDVMAWGRPSEKQALQRSMSELIYIGAFAFLTIAVLGYDPDDEDKNKKLKEMNWFKQAAILMAVRVQGELGTFVPVPVFGLGYMEMKRAILDPFGVVTTSGFNNFAALIKLGVMQMAYWAGADDYKKDLYYSKDMGYNSDTNEFLGYRQKGGSKMWTILLNTVGYTGYTADPAPYVQTISNMQNRVK